MVARTRQNVPHIPPFEDVAALNARRVGTYSFPDDFKGKWVVFFSHPADFTPVCTTEFMTFAAAADEFTQRNAELPGLSIDSTFSHIAWLRTIRERIEYQGQKNIDVTFPVISDLTMEVSKASAARGRAAGWLPHHQ